jgi:hypothetical protein
MGGRDVFIDWRCTACEQVWAVNHRGPVCDSKREWSIVCKQRILHSHIDSKQRRQLVQGRYNYLPMLYHHQS